MKRSQIMKEAWKFYRTIVRFSHLPHRERIAASMKLAWKNAKFAAKCTGKTFSLKAANETIAAAEKKAETKKTVKAYEIPMWLMHEKALMGIRSNVIRFDTIERESAKAFRAHGEWFPKSQCNVITVEA